MIPVANMAQSIKGRRRIGDSYYKHRDHARGPPLGHIEEKWERI